MDDWSKDFKDAPKNGIKVFGHDADGVVEIMHFSPRGWLVPNYDGMGRGHFAAFRPVAWLEIPPINLLGKRSQSCRLTVASP